MEYREKLNEKYMPVLHCISSFEDISHKMLQNRVTSSLFFLHELLDHFLQLFRTSFKINYLKKDFCYKLSFLMDSPKPPASEGPKSA